MYLRRFIMIVYDLVLNVLKKIISVRFEMITVIIINYNTLRVYYHYKSIKLFI